MLAWLGWCAATAVLVLGTSGAKALSPKQCLPIAEINAALKAEGQRSLVIGNRAAVRDAPNLPAGAKVTYYANVVTANADGSLGYQLEGDLPREQASTSMCVRVKLTNVRLLDARTAGVQPASLLGGPLDNEVREKEKLGTRPMVIADTLHDGGGSTERLGLKMVLFGNVKGRSGSLYVRQADGRGDALMLIVDVDYTAEALRRIGQ